jgi:hypothetical protein
MNLLSIVYERIECAFKSKRKTFNYWVKFNGEQCILVLIFLNGWCAFIYSFIMQFRWFVYFRLFNFIRYIFLPVPSGGGNLSLLLVIVISVIGHCPVGFCDFAISLGDQFLLSSYMEYIESIGFTPKILKIFFCSNHVFYR